MMLSANASVALAGPSENDTYCITLKEKAACTADAMRLCMDTYPDEGKLFGCMRSIKASLSSGDVLSRSTWD